MANFDIICPDGFVQRYFPVFELWQVEAVAFGRMEMNIDTRVMVG